jgi:hypothetical protein
VTAEQETVSPPAPPAERRSVPWREVVPVAGALVVAGGALGALGGWLWYQWWGPPNTGEIYDTATWGPRWFDLSDEGLAHQFDGPAQYSVIALGFGALLGIAAVALGRRHAIAAVVGLVIGTALAAYLCWAVGTALSPPDPQQYATADNIGKEYRAAIEVSGWTPFLCWPMAGLGAFCLTILGRHFFGSVREAQSEQQQAGNWLEPAVRADRSVPPPPQ